MGLLTRIRRALAPAKRLDAVESYAQWASSMRRIRGGYDAASGSEEFQNYWANADRYDADSAHSREVRHTLIARSRKSINNNGYADGIAQTYATDLVGVGPQLRMQTESTGFNQMVERTWHLWVQAVKFRRKLWCMAHATYGDGESFAVLRRNPRVNHLIPLDVVLYEAEQIQTPYLPFTEPGYIDGIKFDEFGNPLWYDLLRQHPGMANGMRLDYQTEQVPADRMLHWYKMRRPGQHRGVPECSSTLNVGAAAHRWREATLAAAETAADLNVMLTTQLSPDAVTDPMAPFSTMGIQKRMMTAAPMGWDAKHFASEHPNAQYADFHKSLINEQARPKSMPYNKAACDSSSYNYASGRLDHQTYYAALDVEREDCNDLVLDPLFNVWFDLAIERFGWLGGNSSAVGMAARFHQWDWPKHRVADVQAEASANETKLKSGQVSIPRLKAEAGIDAEDDAEAEAAYYGIAVEELKRRQLDALYPPPKAEAPAQLPAPSDESVEAALRNLARRALTVNGHVNGNGVHHG
jgi:capsid protein